MSYQWRDGFHPPRGVSAEEVHASFDALSTVSPEILLEATKRKRHPLHEDLWREGDQAWAQRGRLERCRHIIGSIEETIIVGGKSIEIRAVEFLRIGGTGRWTMIEEIIEDVELQDAYLDEIQRLQEQAAAKLKRFRSLMNR